MTQQVASPGSPRQVADDVWVVHRPLRFFGVEVGTRMTIVRLRDGGLWLHSPVAIDDPLASAIEALGPVRHIVAPNKLHHLFAGDARSRFADARLHLAPGLAAKRPDLDGTPLGPDASPPWGSQIEVHHVAGLRVLGELVFFHPASETLIVSDLAFNIGPDAPWGTRQFGRLTGTYGKLGCPLDMRLLFIADRDAFAGSLQSIRRWPFSRIVLAHGDIVTEGATAAFDAAFDFVLRSRRTG